MADQTNQNVPSASNQISGDFARQAAIRRLRRKQEMAATQATNPRTG